MDPDSLRANILKKKRSPTCFFQKDQILKKCHQLSTTGHDYRQNKSLQGLYWSNYRLPVDRLSTVVCQLSITTYGYRQTKTVFSLYWSWSIRLSTVLAPMLATDISYRQAGIMHALCITLAAEFLVSSPPYCADLFNKYAAPIILLTLEHNNTYMNNRVK